jgi:hypothetical protein
VTTHHYCYKAYLIISKFNLEDKLLFYRVLDVLFRDLAIRASLDGFIFKLYRIAIN